MNFNAHIIASGNIQTHRVFIGDGSGITNLQVDQLTGIVPSGNLPSDIVYNIDLVNASGDLVGSIAAASGDLSTRLEASGLTLDTKIDVASGDLVSQIASASGALDARLVSSGLVLDTKINVASGDLQTQIDAITAGNVDSVSGIDGGAGFSGDVVMSGLGATIYASGAVLTIEPDVRRASLTFSSGVTSAVLTHGFGERPLVQIFDLNENQVWADVSHNSVNEVQADFLELQTGRLIVIG